MKIVISAGHAKNCRGASGIIDEYDENCKVVDKVFGQLGGYGVAKFIDTLSTSQNENLNRIVDFHNSKTRDLDVSVHFNSYQSTASPMGTECLYVTQEALAAKVAAEVCVSGGLKNRGAKLRTDLFFLNKTHKPSILIEVCFVDSQADVEAYHKNFEAICAGIAATIAGVTPPPPEPPQPPPSGVLFNALGKASYFGGPNDEGVSRTEGLAFISSIDQAPHLFLPAQPAGTTGLARRLNPYTHYVACRWDYGKTPKTMLVEGVALVKAVKTGIVLKAFPADWGPNENTGRVADLSPTLLDDLGIKTDDEVEVTFPA